MKKWTSRILEYAISPVVLGICISAALAYSSKMRFYDYEGSSDEIRYKYTSPTYSFFKTLHDLSIDVRLIARGARKGSPQVAVLAVDNPSIEEIGRWPWPRTRIAEVIEKSIDYGAKVIGFDIVFSESEQNQLHSVLHNLRTEAQATDSHLVEKIDVEIKRSASDQILAQSVAKHKEKLVMGSFNPALPAILFDEIHDTKDRLFPPGKSSTYQEICEDVFQENSRTTQLWQNSQSIIGATLKQNTGSPGAGNLRSQVSDIVGEDLRAVQSEINSTIVEEWFRANEVLANKALPEFVRSISQEEKIHFMDLLFNENFNSIYNLTSELTGREVADEEVFEYLDVFRLAIPNSDRVHVLRRMKADQLLYCARWLTDEDTHLNRFKKRLADFQKENDPKSGDFDFDLFRSTLMAPNAIAENILSRAYDWTMDIPAIANVSGNIGYFNAVIDFDGTVRRTELLKRDGANYVLSLALRTFMVLKKLSPMVYLNEIFDDPSNKGKIGVDHIELTDIDGNKDSSNETILRPRYRGDIYINYAGKQQMFPHVSTKEILSSSENMYIQERIFEEGDWREKSIEVNKREFMKDKILIFGVTATAVYDLRVTPFQENFPGVETHANIVDNLIRNDFLLPNNLEKSIMPYILLAMGVALSLALGNLSATMSMLITAASLAGVYYIDKYLFFSKGTLTAVIFPLLLVFTIYVTLTFYRYVTEERKKKELRTTFAKYVSPQIVNEVLASPENLQLGGRKEVMTVFFSDIRGFTTISEKLDPEALSDLLNEYLTPMTEIVFANRGTLDKYMGDAVMAFFGAPISTATHADDACRCALQSIRKTIELQQVFRERNYPIIDIGIGLNTGEMSVGNMGSNIVRNYTVMGDAVNLGSRLEAINKEYGTRIIISEFTKNVISKDFVTREVDWVRVKGKLLPVRIFELIAEGSIDPSQEELLKYFCEGFHLYHEQQWKRSLSSFEQALQVNPQDYASKLYLERCQGYIIEPPPEEWDGVFTMKTK